MKNQRKDKKSVTIKRIVSHCDLKNNSTARNNIKITELHVEGLTRAKADRKKKNAIWNKKKKK